MGLVHPKLKVTKPPLFLDLTDNLDSIDANGHLPVPQVPRLGVTIDWEWVKKHEAGKVVYDGGPG